MYDQSVLRVDGALYFHNLSEWTRQRDLKEKLTEIGFEKFAPGRRTASDCILDALKHCFPGDFRIEKLALRDSWEVREIERGEEANEYILRHVVHLREENGDPRILVGPFCPQVAEKVVSKFNDYLGLVRNEAVTSCANSILRSLHGISMRHRGSLYWIPPLAIDTMRKVCGAIESSSIGECSCHVMRHIMDADALRAIKEGFVAEAEAQVVKIQKDINEGELGERALENRKAAAIALRDKIKLYETILHEPMPALVAAADGAHTAACTAAILANVAAAPA